MNTILNELLNLPPEAVEGISSWAQVVISFFTFLVAMFTFYLAIMVRKRIFKIETVKKQVEVVTELVNELNFSRIYVEGWETSESGGIGSSFAINYNIFEIGDLLRKGKGKYIWGNPSLSEFDDEIIILDHGTNQIWDIKSFINNPFLPKSIADELLNFYSRQVTVQKKSEQQYSKYVLLASGIFEKGKVRQDYKDRDHFIGDADALKTWLNLKTYANNLSKILDKWFRSHGIKDINLRIDYKN